MLQLIRSIEANVRKLVRSVRHAPRHRPHLPFSLSMPEQVNGQSTQHAIKVNGFTHNISETGMALIVPGVRKGDYHLAARNRRLLIVLELPTGPIRIQAAPIRYERATMRAGYTSGYLIGVRIVSMSDDHKVRFIRYLNRLSRGEKITAKKSSPYNERGNLR